MDTLILRTALLLCLPVSSVARMQATDVLALSVAHAEAETEKAQARDLAAISNAFLVNAAVWAPESLKEIDSKARARAGIVAPAMTTPAVEAMFAAMPLQETV